MRLVLAVLGALLVLPAVAAAQEPVGGTTTLTLRGGGFKALGGTKVAAVAPALSRGTRVALPVTRARIGRVARLDHGGRVRLRRGRRTLTLQDVQVDLGAMPALSARVGGARVTLAWLRLDRWPLDAGARTVKVGAARAVLTRLGATTLRRKLGLKRTPAGELLRVAVDARPGGRLVAPVGATGTPVTEGGPTPVSKPITSEPPVLARPATAVDIVSASATWSVRESFVQYIATGEGTTARDGAVAAAPRTTASNDVPLTYEFGFPFARGWYDPPTNTAAIHLNGTVNFSYRERTIDLNTTAPELELTGAASRSIMRFSGSGGTDLGGKRAVLVNLDPAKAASATTSPDGRTRTLERIPGTIPEGTDESVFAGFYFPGDPFGWWTVSFTTG